jgi:hypothetical protein
MWPRSALSPNAVTDQRGKDGGSADREISLAVNSVMGWFRASSHRCSTASLCSASSSSA